VSISYSSFGRKWTLCGDGMLINLMCPTYNRPDSIRTFCDSALRTADDVSKLRFTFCINKEDNTSLEYIQSRYWPNDSHVHIVFEETEQPNLALYFNMMYEDETFKDPNTIVSMLGDDMVFETQGWDTAVLKAMEEMNGAGLVFCDDGYIAHERLCVNLFTTRKVVDASEKPFMCELFHADMIDTVWYHVGTMANLLKYLDKVVIKHNHNTRLGMNDWDDTFKRLRVVQAAVNTQENHKLAAVYATLCAGNIIDKGIGKWNVL